MTEYKDTDAGKIEGLSAQIVHAQMVLQDALGYKETDYSISLTDLALDIEKIRQERDDAIRSLKYFDALWADWYTYCMSGDKSYRTILDWMYGTHTHENVAKWIRVASETVRRIARQFDVG